MIREAAAVAFAAAIACILPLTAPAGRDAFGLEEFFQRLDLDAFCDKHHGHPRCKKLEELRAFCAANPMDTTRCNTSAGALLRRCESQDSEDRAYCAGVLDAQLDTGAAPQLGSPVLNLSEPVAAIGCVPAGVLKNPEQLRILFVREAYRHPEVLHFPVRQLLYYALAKTYPCLNPLKAKPE